MPGSHLDYMVTAVKKRNKSLGLIEYVQELHEPITTL